MNNQYKIILGSSSPRRQELISKITKDFTIIKPGYDEQLQPGQLPKEYVKLNSMKKGEWIHQNSDIKHLIISADTIVVLGEKILQKPKSEAEALEMLKTLSNNCHEVLSSVCVTTPDGQQKEHTESTLVYFRKLTEVEIKKYIETGEPMDKAGSYGIQGIGSDFVCKIEGSMSNVIGLPIHALEGILQSLGSN